MAIDNFKFWCQKVLPLVYDDSLSYYEVLCKVSSKLNEVINSENALMEEWQKFKDEFDNNLYNVVEQIFNEWKNDGTFNDLINNILLGHAVNVKDYGAKGDGITDDTEAFQRAVDTGYNVYVPTSRRENYLLKGTVNFNTIRQTMFSDDDNQPAGTSNLAGCIIFNYNVAIGFQVNVSDVHFKNLSFRTNVVGGVNPRITHCIKALNTVSNEDLDIRVEYCTFFNFAYALDLTGRGVHVRENYFATCDRCVWLNFTPDSEPSTGFRGAKYGYRAVRIIQNRFHDVSQFAIYSQTGTIFSGEITGNVMDTGRGFLRFQNGCNSSIISNNIIDFCQTNAINIQNVCNNTTISNNSFYSDLIENISQITTLTPACISLINTNEGYGNIITGNTINGALSTGILINGSPQTNTIISNNSFERIGDIENPLNSQMPIVTFSNLTSCVISSNTFKPQESQTVPAITHCVNTPVIKDCSFIGNEGILYDMSGQYTLDNVYSQKRLSNYVKNGNYIILTNATATVNLTEGYNTISIPKPADLNAYKNLIAIYNNCSNFNDVTPLSIFSGVTEDNLTFRVNSAQAHNSANFNAYIVRVLNQTY